MKCVVSFKLACLGTSKGMFPSYSPSSFTGKPVSERKQVSVRTQYNLLLMITFSLFIELSLGFRDFLFLASRLCCF